MQEQKEKSNKDLENACFFKLRNVRAKEYKDWTEEFNNRLGQAEGKNKWAQRQITEII